MILLQNVTKKYGNKTVISDLTYTFADGTVYILHGKSGSGKSTLLSLIAGTDKKYDGSITRSSVSMSFQNANLLPSFSVIDNVLLAVSGKNRPAAQTGSAYRKEQTERAANLLNALGIYDNPQTASELSGGMQARVGIARALMKPADVYLFDEPFAGLDSDTVRESARVIREHTKGKTVIAVVHDSISVPGFADTVLELLPGPPTVLRELPDH